MTTTSELINDNRLTPTMNRVRSGNKQLFREKDNNNRSFINDENCDVSLEHKIKSMYAELIEGQWFWVNGCAECNGKERDWMTYIECEEHDRCRSCQTKRADVKVAWGGKRGWECGTCHEEFMINLRSEAFEKLGGELPDCSYTDDIICPHCGSKISSEDVYQNEETECDICGGELKIEVMFERTFTTTIKGKRIRK